MTRDGARAPSDASTRHTTIETRSLTESIREHVIEGGFRYHAYHAGKYPFPNDDIEQQCDEMRHVLSLALCEGRSFYAPVEGMLEKGAEVLDLGELFLCMPLCWMCVCVCVCMCAGGVESE